MSLLTSRITSYVPPVNVRPFEPGTAIHPRANAANRAATFKKSSASTPFQYGILPDVPESRHIRVLELLPGRGPDLVRCNLRVARLSEATYEGLSYCWGNIERICSMDCNGAPLPVTANLLEALRALRYENKPRQLWVDAICVNQDDIEERNHQVACMRDIYSHATRTVVWLGPEADGSAVAFSIIPDLLAIESWLEEDFKTSVRPSKILPIFSMSAEELGAIPRLLSLSENTKARIAFTNLMQRPWFSRVWVIQEVAVASKVVVICGSGFVTFEHLATAAITFQQLELHQGVGPQLPLYYVRTMWDTRLQHSAHRSAFAGPNFMFMLLHRHRYCRANEPRDKVYAFNGMAGGDMARPDYNLGSRDAYTRLASEMLLSDIGLDLFCAVHPSQPPLSGLPSWVPDWSATDYFNPFRVPRSYALVEFEQGIQTSLLGKGNAWARREPLPPGIPACLLGKPLALVRQDVY